MVKSQNLKQHQWSERVLVVYSERFDSEMARDQLKLFEKSKEGLADRSLVVYHITSEGYRKDFGGQVSDSGNNTSVGGFEVNLIGLDGGIKYESNSVEAVEVYFNLIDRMPMRRAEMRKRIKKGGGG